MLSLLVYGTMRREFFLTEAQKGMRIQFQHFSSICAISLVFLIEVAIQPEEQSF